ncbi:MAG: cation:proton antiporter [Cyanophyceae cyanobacterium]
MVSDNVFSEIALLLAIATAVGAGALWLRQPLIIAFIAVGIIEGPAGLGLLAATDEVELLAELGIALLLFVVGLKLDPHEIRAVGPVAIVAGLGQITVTTGLGYGMALLLGLRPIAAFYIAIALTFSSTIIVVKLLSDKKEIDALHSRIAVGILIVQDIAVVLVMIGLTAFSGEGNAQFGQALLMVLVKGGSFLFLIAFASRTILPKILHALAQSTELLLLFAIAWAIALAAVGSALGFSQEVGAFLAGVALASTTYRAILSARLVSLRDFLLLFFFINLGVHIDVAHLGSQLIPGLIFSLFVLVGKPLTIAALVGSLGYRKYTSALTSLSLGQISEFSLILGTLGVSLGHISDETLGLITLVGLITMGVSTYAILDSHIIYHYCAPWLSFFERSAEPEKSLNSATALDPVDVIIFGLGRYGGNLLENFPQYGLSVFGVDFDPELVRLWRSRGVSAVYGDAEDPEFAAMLPLNQARWVISTVPGQRIGLILLHALAEHQFAGRIALTSHTERETEVLRSAGADLVLLPFRDAAKEAARAIAQLSR